MALSGKFQIIIPPQDIACEPGLQLKLANGDRDAFAWVYKNYCKRIFDYAMIMTANEEQAEDIVQDVFIRLWMNREKMRCIENFNGYMNMMCRNHIMNVFRSEKREVAGKKNYSAQLSDTYNAVEDIINYKETNSIIADAVKELPKCRRQIFEMTQSGLNNKEIVQQLGIRPRTVWNQLQRAGKFLKDKLNNS